MKQFYRHFLKSIGAVPGADFVALQAQSANLHRKLAAYDKLA